LDVDGKNDRDMHVFFVTQKHVDHIDTLTLFVITISNAIAFEIIICIRWWRGHSIKNRESSGGEGLVAPKLG